MSIGKQTKTVALGCKVWFFDADCHDCPICDFVNEVTDQKLSKAPVFWSGSKSFLAASPPPGTSIPEIPRILGETAPKQTPHLVAEK